MIRRFLFSIFSLVFVNNFANAMVLDDFAKSWIYANSLDALNNIQSINVDTRFAAVNRDYKMAMYVRNELIRQAQARWRDIDWFDVQSTCYCSSSYDDALIYSVAFSQDCESVAIASDDGLVDIYSIIGTEWVRKFKFNRNNCGHINNVMVLAFSPDGTFLVSGDERGVVKICKKNPNGSWHYFCEFNQSDDEYKAKVTSITFSSDGTILAYGLVDGSVYIFNLDIMRRDWRCIGDFDSESDDHSYPLNSLLFNNDSSSLIFVSENGEIDLYCKNKKKKWDCHGNFYNVDTPKSQLISCVAYSPDGKLVAFGSKYGAIYIYRVDGQNIADHTSWKSILETKDIEDVSVTALSFGADSKTLLVGLSDGVVNVYRCFAPKKWNAIASFNSQNGGHSHFVHSILYSPNMDFFLASTFDGCIKIYRPHQFYSIKDVLVFAKDLDSKMAQ